MKFKEHYGDQYIRDFSAKLASVMPWFDKEGFCNNLIGRLDDLELFERLDVIVDVMSKTLDSDYSKNVNAFFNVLGPELEDYKGMYTIGWWLWPTGRYVERYGNENWSLSLAFLKELTKRFTGEFAIRTLIKEHPKEVLDELIVWTKDENVHVRRLASEGVRTRLPWSQKLYAALDEFERYYTILTNLKDDPEKFVQKSVGNNLNDLFKDDPKKAQWIIDEWAKTKGSKAQEWIIKHGMRNQNKG